VADVEGHEFVAHVFLAANGPDRQDDYRWLVELWHRCAAEFHIDQPLAPRPDAPPPDELPAADGLVAACTSGAAGLHQLVLRRLGDVCCLSLLRSPDPDTGWPGLDQEWSSVNRPSTSGVLGTVRIMQARLADPGAALDAAVLDPVVRTDSGWAGRWGEGLLRAEPSLGPFAVWEVLADGQRQRDRDGRADRRIVVVAPRASDAQLSAWTWSRGDDELTPFPQYLLHAAKARYELRLWAQSRSASELRRETDQAIAPLLRMTTTAAGTGHEPDPDQLLAASVTLVGLQARELGLVDRASRWRDLRRTVAVASANMAAHVGGDQSGGLFADDAAMLRWFDRQLEHDLTYLDAAVERASGVTTLADQLVNRGIARRQERVNLGLAGVVGAVVLVLAAIQSFAYKVPIPDVVQPAVIALLGAFALFTSMIAVRLAAPRRAFSAVLVCLAAGLLGAATAWTVVAVVVPATATIGIVAGWSGFGGLIGLLTAAFLVRSG
jgi:hypothetical protein